MLSKDYKLRIPLLWMKKLNRFLFWAPRVFLILFALFLAVFSLDVFGNNYTLWETAIALFMHNIPSIILLVILLISWKHDLVGSIIFIILGVACVVGVIIAIFNLTEADRFNPILIIGSVVFLLIGILFLAGWKQGKKFRKHK